jgi:hypothetical protein
LYVLKSPATPFAQAALISLMLSSCHPYGCGSSQCVKDHEYEGAKRCNAVLEAGLVIVSSTPLPRSAQFDRGEIQSELIDGMDNTLRAGARLGMSREAIYADLNRAKHAYLSAYAAKKADPHEKLVALFDDVNLCLPHSKPND